MGKRAEKRLKKFDSNRMIRKKISDFIMSIFVFQALLTIYIFIYFLKPDFSFGLGYLEPWQLNPHKISQIATSSIDWILSIIINSIFIFKTCFSEIMLASMSITYFINDFQGIFV
jgi:hypothetical protein